jgi:hypothetical protein
LVVTRWRDLPAFEAWRSSASFAHGHRPETPTADAPAGSSDAARPSDTAPAAAPPMPIQAELWSYEVATASTPDSPTS